MDTRTDLYTRFKVLNDSVAQKLASVLIHLNGANSLVGASKHFCGLWQLCPLLNFHLSDLKAVAMLECSGQR